MKLSMADLIAFPNLTKLRLSNNLLTTLSGTRIATMLQLQV